jgi:hypothetical protein
LLVNVFSPLFRIGIEMVLNRMHTYTSFHPTNTCNHRASTPSSRYHITYQLRDLARRDHERLELSMLEEDGEEEEEVEEEDGDDEEELH